MTKIQEFGNDNTALAPYTFEYNLTNQGLPSRRSFNQDHWGYYNGAGNSTLVPSIIYNGYVLPGADRKPYFSAAIQGTLSKITFPTGGSKSFVYELNECNNCSFLDYASVSNVQYETHTMGSSDFFANQNQSIIEKTFTVDGQEPGKIILNMSTETSFCGSWPCQIELKLYSLNPDNSINQLVFDSYQYRNEPDINILDIVVDYTFSGKYKLQMKVNDSQWASNQDEYYLQVKWAIPLSTSGFEYNNAGGLRTKQIELYDPVSNQTIQKNYTYEDGYLSGWLSYARMSEFIYGFTSCPTYPPNMVCNPQPMFGLGMARTSNPILSTSNTKGGIVGYNKVTVSELGNGYIENYYYSPYQHRDINWIEESYNSNTISELPQERTFKGDILIDTEDWAFPFSLSDEKDWKRGLIKKQLFYKRDNSLQKKIETKYHFYDDITHNSYNPSKVRSIKGSRTGAELAYYSGTNGQIGQISVNFYTLQSSWYDIDEVIETNYFDNGQELTTTTKYDYSPNQRTVKTTTLIDSNGIATEHETLYPTDYSNSYLGSNILRDRNMINMPLVQKTFKDGNLLNEKRSNYILNGTLVDLDFIENLPHGIDSDIKTNILRDTEGNITQVSQTNAPPVSYVWGYNKIYPVAKLENIEYSDIENNTTLYNYLDQLDSYTLIDDSNRATLKTLNENIRNSTPINSMVTTYTYDPLIGVTSITDAKGYTTYYEYDGFNRLKQVKDAEGNILSENQYNYKQ
ncbi:RHS repeat domain-containing protein [Jejuia pallidilutea]|uniref:RHS repeat domain-containing protein n=1 Tax=Jejuia pallidilutea TaxID=504487 RepID=UPI0011AFFEE0|nr:RHS repeat domain-containing protein [Jejuia pallidilutea]